MSILIVALPRTGSTELGRSLSVQKKYQYGFEVFNPAANLPEPVDFKRMVVKTIIFHKPKNVEERDRLDWIIDLTKKFEEVILLSRKDLIACAESWAYLIYKGQEKDFKSIDPYLWEKTPNYDSEYDSIKKWNKEIQYLSESLKIPITYYEDIYDLNHPGRLRKGDLNNFEKKII